MLQRVRLGKTWVVTGVFPVRVGALLPTAWLADWSITAQAQRAFTLTLTRCVYRISNNPSYIDAKGKLEDVIPVLMGRAMTA